MELYLCRHGETEWTITGQHTGVSDIPLTQKGLVQAAQLRKRLEKVHFEKVFTSPRQRAVVTCQGMNAVVEPLAAEWNYGDYEGITTKQIKETRPDWNLFRDGAPNGENAQQVGARADQLLKKMSHYQGKVAVFSHGHFLRVLAARFLGLAPEFAKMFILSVASVSILSHERGQPAIALWNDTHQLEHPIDQKE